MTDSLTVTPRASVSPTPRDVAAILFRRPRLVAISFAITTLAVMLFVAFSARYESHFKVLLRRGRLDPMISAQPSSNVDFSRPVTEEELNSEVVLLKDEDLLRSVVLSAGLIDPTTKQADLAAEMERAVRKLTRRLDVEGLRKSNLIQVSYKDSDAQRSERILASLSKAYMQKHTSLLRPEGQVSFFSEQAADSEKKLRQSETELVNFTRASGVVSAILQRDIAVEKLGETDASIRLIDQDRAEAEKRIAMLGDQLKLFPPRSVTTKRWADNPQVLEKMKTHLLELQLKRTELLTRFEPSYRLVQEVEQQVSETKATIDAEALTPIRDETTDRDPNFEWARLELEKTQVQKAGLLARFYGATVQADSLRETAKNLQARSVEQQDLVRSVKADEDNYLLYLRKLEEARIGEALDESAILNAAIVEPPVVPALPNHPLALYLLPAFGLATLSSIGLAFAADYYDPTVRTPQEAIDVLNVPVLAWFPTTGNGISRSDRPQSAFTKGERS